MTTIAESETNLTQDFRERLNGMGENVAPAHAACRVKGGSESYYALAGNVTLTSSSDGFGFGYYSTKAGPTR